MQTAVHYFFVMKYVVFFLLYNSGLRVGLLKRIWRCSARQGKGKSCGGDYVTEEAKNEDNGFAELMYVKCAGCGKWMDVKPGHLNLVSHSLCNDCLQKEMEKAKSLFPDMDTGPEKTP